MRPVSCIIVDDEKEATFRLAAMLSKIDGIKIAGIHNDPEGAMADIIQKKPNLVFSDIEMPGMSGFDLVAAVRKTGYIPNFIFVTGYNQYAIKAIKSAAFDYLVKPVDLDELKEAIERFRKTAPRTVAEAGLPEKFQNLSQREIEIIRLIVACKTSREIAEKLFISKNTVDTHRRNILEKLELKNTRELIVLAMENDLT